MKLTSLHIYTIVILAFAAQANAGPVEIPEALVLAKLAVFSDLYKNPGERKGGDRQVLLRIQDDEWQQNHNSYIKHLPSVKQVNRFRDDGGNEGITDTDDTPREAVMVDLVVTGIVFSDCEVLASLEASMIRESDGRNEYFWYHIKASKDGRTRVVEKKRLSYDKYWEAFQVSILFRRRTEDERMTPDQNSAKLGEQQRDTTCENSQ